MIYCCAAAICDDNAGMSDITALSFTNLKLSAGFNFKVFPGTNVCKKLQNTFPFQDIFSILARMVLVVIKSVFMITIVLTHNGVRGYLSNLYLIRNFTTLLSVSQVRQITADQSNIELHGMT